MTLTRKIRSTTRRSVVIPASLMKEIKLVLDADPESNLNRLVNIALREHLAQRRREEFKTAMARMGADPAIRKESSQINKGFMRVETDGL